MKRTAGILALVLSGVFLILAFITQVPDKHIKSWGTGKMEEYVGGDAYNFIIEASLRGGEIAGAKTEKAIYFGISAILAVVSCSFLTDNSSGTKQKELNEIPKQENVFPDEIPAPDSGDDEQTTEPEQTEQQENEDIIYEEEEP